MRLVLGMLFAHWCPTVNKPGLAFRFQGSIYRLFTLRFGELRTRSRLRSLTDAAKGGGNAKKIIHSRYDIN
jgi:hypothetical protein